MSQMQRRILLGIAILALVSVSVLAYHLSPPHVKRQPWFWEYLPTVTDQASYAIYPTIYLTDRVFDDIYSGRCSRDALETLAHELFHITRYERVGVVTFGIKYWVSRDFALREQKLAAEAEETMFDHPYFREFVFSHTPCALDPLD